MSVAALVLPHQLFDPHPAMQGASRIVLVEEPLFFTQYAFHAQKLRFHRETMTRYLRRLAAQGLQVDRVDAHELADTGAIATRLAASGVHAVRIVDPSDDWVEHRLAEAFARAGVGVTWLPDPHALTPESEARAWLDGRQRLFFTDFYITQRRRLGLLIDRNGKPAGGQWSFDPENRKKLPKGLAVPWTAFPEWSADTRAYVRQHYPSAPGADEGPAFPADHDEAAAWLERFVRERLPSFGDYEDAIAREHEVLFHSVLTPMLNVGLLSPTQVIDAALDADDVPLNALEGFIRQIIGWREFVRMVYRDRGRAQRTSNFWGFTHGMPRAFYDGTTGLEPVDHVVRRVLRTGWCHHIERLMILGNVMLLCEVHPDAVYRWFMELFVDAYDWVMVPNVYGMSQYADGGGMTTKPYISASAYVLKMSDFPKGEWCRTWDALYWRFIDRHAAVFEQNPRLAMMAKMRLKLGPKLEEHRRVAEDFLDRLHGR
ncbi:MAG: cryptochrome/photolyase family protein [Vicinamibacterales bacterium]